MKKKKFLDITEPDLNLILNLAKKFLEILKSFDFPELFRKIKTSLSLENKSKFPEIFFNLKIP